MIERNKEARAAGQQKPFPTWQLSNSNANIGRVKTRIQALQNARDRQPMQPKQGCGWQMYEDKEENRVMFRFTAIPAEAQRTELKRRGFKWSPTRGAWVRQITPNALHAARMIIEQLPA